MLIHQMILRYVLSLSGTGLVLQKEMTNVPSNNKLSVIELSLSPEIKRKQLIGQT